MDSDSDEEKYYTSEDTEDEEEPRPPSQRSSISQPPSPHFSVSSSEDEDDVGNVAGQQPQPSLWTLPPKPRRCVVQTFIGAPNGKSSEAAIVADYNRHMGHVGNAHRMANSYPAIHQTWKWTKKLFFHLLDLAIVNSHILLSSCGGKKVSHRDFRLTLSERCWHGLGMSHDHPCL